MPANGPDEIPCASTFLEAFGSAVCSGGFEEHVLCRTDSGPLLLWCSESWSADKPVGLITAGIHGDEPAGPLALMRLLREQGLPEGWNWVLAPLMNPVGWDCRSRGASNCSDLNRDFLQFNSIESKAFCGWWESRGHGCDFHLSLHEDWETSGLYLYEINTSTRPGHANGVLDRVGACHPLQVEGPVDDHQLARAGLILHEPIPDEPEGWPEAIWLCQQYQVLSHTWESPSQRPLPERVAMLSCVLNEELRILHRLTAEGTGR